MPFAAYPWVFIRDEPKEKGKRKQQLIWGDFVAAVEPPAGTSAPGGWRMIRSRGETGWVKDDEVQDERLLEVNFVDIGQGDGCFVVTPDDRFILVDAGERDNMVRFLRWRFNIPAKPERRIRFQSAVITHPDQDHYLGFARLFDDEAFEFDTVYHNGIVERKGADPLGPRVKQGSHSYLTDIIRDRAALEPLLADESLTGGKRYPGLLRKALENGRVGDIRALSADDRFLPGYDAGDLTIEILGPLYEPDAAGKPRLRWLGSDDGPTKNGHSIVLRWKYHDVTLLLGGDLNIESERLILERYGGADPVNADAQTLEAIVASARARLRCDVAKACHHGSADFAIPFIRALDPIAVVISSGDDEPHCHPRPDALGSYGRYGRGERPLIFSTELARSASESIKNPQALRERIEELYTLRAAAEDTETREKIQERIDTLLASIDRSIAVYGMITLRTDGRKLVLAQKLERPRASTREEFDIHRLEPGPAGLRYVSKH